MKESALIAQEIQGVFSGLASRWRNLYYRLRGVKIRGYARLNRISILGRYGDITLGPGVALDDRVTLQCVGPAKQDKLVINSFVYINRYTVIEAHSHVEIGSYCMIGPHCYLCDALPARPSGLSGSKPEVRETHPIILEEDVWLGAHVRVMPGVRIGRGAIIGAGAVVEQDIPPVTIAVGVPARPIKLRPELHPQCEP
jgi:acetyltransferase-like isoleucine patch superfamily enzyme